MTSVTWSAITKQSVCGDTQTNQSQNRQSDNRSENRQSNNLSEDEEIEIDAAENLPLDFDITNDAKSFQPIVEMTDPNLEADWAFRKILDHKWDDGRLTMKVQYTDSIQETSSRIEKQLLMKLRNTIVSKTATINRLTTHRRIYTKNLPITTITLRCTKDVHAY